MQQGRSAGRGLLLGLGLSVLAATGAPADEPVALDAFDGRWQRVADEAAEAARLASIDTAIADLSWLVRKMASGVLTRTTAPPGEIAFVWDGAALHQRVRGPNGQIDRPVRPGAGPRQQKDGRGEDTTVEWRRTAEGLEVHWTQSQAFGRNLYRLDPARETLYVEHRIQVTAIDGVEEIAFASRFAREALPTVSSARSPSADMPIGQARVGARP